MNFSKALKQLKQGSRVYKLEWTEKASCTPFLEMRKHDFYGSPEIHIFEDGLYDYWMPKQSDIMSDDWYTA
jgi:hypothetical protein